VTGQNLQIVGDAVLTAGDPSGAMHPNDGRQLPARAPGIVDVEYLVRSLAVGEIPSRPRPLIATDGQRLLIKMAAIRRSCDIAGASQGPSRRPTVATQRLDQPSLGRRQQLREQREVRAAGGTKLKRGAHVDSDHMPTRREPQLALAGEQHVPGFMLVPADQACSR
jgi:hypothetical protein